MFYLCVIPTLAMSLYMAVYLGKLKKHDTVLYRFCQIRRNAMSLLRDRNFGIKKEEYYRLRDLTVNLNLMINKYKEYKTVIFNFRRFKKYLKEYKASIQEVEKFKTSDNKQIENLYGDFSFAIFHAFLEYTPLIRSEITIRVVLFIMTALTMMGVRYFNNITTQFSEAARIVNEQSDKLKKFPQYSQA